MVDLSGSAILVAGATGELGWRLSRALKEAGAHVVPAGRNEERLADLATELGASPVALDITDPGSCSNAVEAAIEQLGRLDGIVLATGVVAFGRSGELPRDSERELVIANAIGPIDLIATALPRLEQGGAVVALSAVVADYPTAGMAAYSASKAALSSYLTAIRRERRKELDVVLDVRPGHMETGFSDRALAGEAPKLPSPRDEGELIDLIVEAIEAGDKEISYDPRTRELTRG